MEDAYQALGETLFDAVELPQREVAFLELSVGKFRLDDLVNEVAEVCRGRVAERA